MAEKLRSRYLDVLKERDVSLQETKRIRHDYELYVKQNDQVKTLLCYRCSYIGFHKKFLFCFCIAYPIIFKDFLKEKLFLISI
jgi:hypothetical protein